MFKEIISLNKLNFKWSNLELYYINIEINQKIFYIKIEMNKKILCIKH